MLFRSGITVSDFLNLELDYAMTVANFDEVTAGNAQKYNFVVAEDGSMDFARIISFVEVARNAGLTIYGHTLCWHAQQTNNYLNGLIADKTVVTAPGEPQWIQMIEGGDCESDNLSFATCDAVIGGADWEFGVGADGTGRSLKVVCPAIGENDWDTQFFITFSEPLDSSKEYRFSMNFRSDDDAAFATQAHYAPTEYKHWSMFGELTSTPEWQTYTKIFTPSADQEGAYTFAFNLAKYMTTYYFDDISLEIYDDGMSGSPEAIVKSYVFNCDFEDGITPWGGWGNSSVREHGIGEGFNGGNCMKMINPSAVNSWEAQTAYDFSTPLDVYEVYYMDFKIKGSTDGSIGGSFQNPDGYVGCGDYASIAITTEWVEQTIKATVTGENALRFLFNFGTYAGTIWLDDLSMYKEVKTGGNTETIILTDEEKAEVLTNELERWIKGMMEACDGYVTTWDVVNEPMSDWPDQYQLKTGVGKDDPDNFYWQDYLGKGYARIPVKLARQYGPDNMILFINEYGLEGDNNTKCKGLIEMIKYWESDGETVIDGIGSQMHVNYYLNEEKQAQNEANVVNMYKLLAETGKLIKVSELDMGIVNVAGTALQTDYVTFEQHQKMADFYQFIIEKYFELIPANQRYGITQWAALDSPENSYWRKGEPIGLWTTGYIRKPQYGGFAEGLISGK